MSESDRAYLPYITSSRNVQETDSERRSDDTNSRFGPRDIVHIENESVAGSRVYSIQKDFNSENGDESRRGLYGVNPQDGGGPGQYENYSDDISLGSRSSNSRLLTQSRSQPIRVKSGGKANLCSRVCGGIKAGVNRLIWGKVEDCVHVKRVIGVPVGLLLAAGLYFTIIRSLKLPYYLRDSIGALIGVNLALGFAFSAQVRCIVCLLLPVFFAKKGRSYVTTYAVAFLIAGPISNIVENGGEITRSLSCSAELLANHTKAKMKLRFQPIKEIAQDLQKEGFKMEKIIQKINKAFAPIRKEIEDVREIKSKKSKSNIDDRYKNSKNDAEKAENKFEKKLDYRCEDIFEEGVKACRQKFIEAEKKCMKKLWLLGYVLCLPLKLTFLCQIVRLASAGIDCNSQKVVNPGLGETYTASDQTMTQFDKQFDVKMKYKMERSKQTLDVTEAYEAVLAIRNQFRFRQRFMDFFLTLMQTLLTFTFVLLFMSAYKYHKKFISDFTFDNTYITHYFRRIDARRRVQGKRTMLPLKKMEAKTIHDPSRVSMKSGEKKKLIKGVMKLLIHVVIAVVVIFVDRMLYTILDIIRRHSRIDYHQQGTHEINVQIYGTGFLARIIRDVLKHFNKKHAMDNVSTNFECLPNPTAVQTNTIYTIFGIYALVLVLMFTESYGLRLRRVIASYYYPKREKRRVLYLYNDLLKKRVGFLHHARRRIKDLARKRQLSQSTSLAATFLEAFPRLCIVMKLCVKKRNACLICEDTVGKAYISCPTPGCNFGYCPECWFDVGELCYACMPMQDFENDSTSDSDQSNSDTD